MSPRPSTRSASLAIVWLVSLAVFGLRANAQTVADSPDATFRATRGVFVPGGVRAGEADATAVELNPGQLPLLDASAVAVVGDLWRREAAMPGRGAAISLAAPVWGAGGLGIGLHGLPASGGADQLGHTKFQLAYGIGGRKLGLGISWAHLLGGNLGGVDTFDVGGAWRPFSRTALALVIEDFARPRLPGPADPLPRRWVGELGLRPFGTNRLEVAAAALHVGGDRWSRLATRFRLTARLWGALGILGDLELAPRQTGASPAGVESGIDKRVTFGLALDFDHATVILAARRAFTPAGAGGGNWGTSAVWHGRAERNAVAIAPARVVRMNLEGVDSDRKFLDLVLRLRALARDTTVAAVYLRIEEPELGLGRIEEVRDLLGDMRRRGKLVIAYLTHPSTRDLYLASACDKVVMHPAGELTFAGLSQAVTFYKGAMDRLGVGVDLVRIAEFKGAMEPYVMTGQSAPVRKNRDDLLDDVYARILSGIAEGRIASGAAMPGHAMDVARLEALVAVGSFTPVEAKEAGLVDAVRDDVEIEAFIKDVLGRPSIEIDQPDPAPIRPVRWSRTRVAVILIDGTITDGSSKRLPFGLGSSAGADTLVEALEECRRNHNVRAVVLRVNSPGGSAFSSDVIARAVSRLRAAGKPVVTSMGDVAASGGYYIAAPTDEIFAEPSTTTGSIGIFGFKLDVSKLLQNLSITVEVFRRGPHADEQSPYRPWTAEERIAAEGKIRHLYGLFVATVAQGRKGRGFTPERVDQVGRGHVWTGSQARKLGLVDEIGGLAAAIDRAAVLGEVPLQQDEAPELLILPRPTGTVLERLAGLEQAAMGGAPPENPPRLARPIRSALKLAAPYLLGPDEGVEARLPYDLDIR